MPHDKYCDVWRPLFDVTTLSDAPPVYRCLLTIPGHVWLRVLDSGPQPSKRAARAAAALAAAAALHAGGALTDNLVPMPTLDFARAEREATLLADDEDEAVLGASDSDSDDAGGMLRCEPKSPDVLEPITDAGALGNDAAAGTLLGLWHVSALLEDGPQADAATHPVAATRFALLSRAPLPPLPPLRLVARGRPACARVVPLAPLQLDEPRHEAALRRFLAWAHAALWAEHPGVGALSPLAAPLAADGATLDWALLCAADAPWAESACEGACPDAATAVGCVAWTHHGRLHQPYYVLRVCDDVTADTLVEEGKTLAGACLHALQSAASPAARF
jgi:hypothetical protein